MRAQEFPMCCGLNIINGLGVVSEDELRKEIKSNSTSRMQTGKASLIALNDAQETRYGKILIEEGFVKILNGSFNAQHNSHIFLYALVREQDKKRSYPDLFNTDY